MKRLFSIALALALAGTSTFSPAFAAGLDVVGEAPEDSVAEVEMIGTLAPDLESEAQIPEEEETLAGEEDTDPSFEETGFTDVSEAEIPAEDQEPAAPEEEQPSDEAQAPSDEDEGETPDEEEAPSDEEEEIPEEGETPSDEAEEEAPADEDEEASEPGDEASEAADATGIEEEEESEEEICSEEVASESAAVAASSVQLGMSSIAIGLKEKFTIPVVPLTADTAIPAITWRTSNKKIATVSSAGVVTGVKEGSATIYAKLGKSSTELKCKITVKGKPSKVTLSKTSLTLCVGVNSQLKATLPKGTASGKLTWTSSKSSVATVDASGVITPIKAGSATITVKTYNGKKATCKLTVIAAPASVSFPDSIIPMAVGQTLTVTATALTSKNVKTPAIITYAIEPDSPDAGCVTVDSATGALKAIRKGVAVLRATTHNGIVTRCQVSVDVPPKAVNLNVASVSIGVKEIYVGLIADLVAPDGADSCAQIVKWSSSNKKIATVDADTGAITGVASGSATITATTPNGKTAKCKVKVLKAPSSVSISPAVGSLIVGQKGQYKVTLPSGSGGSLFYSSSNPNVASIDSNGVVTAVAPGAVKITVTAYNGKTKTAELQVSNPTLIDTDDGSKSGNAERIQYLLSLAKKKLDCPYVYGNFGPNAFDCSGFVYWCYKQINIKLKDSAYKQGYDSTYPKISYEDLIPGDVVFFNTVDDSDLSDHAGLYLGNGKFIHASSAAGKVIISKLSSGYYQRNFSWGRRIIH